MQATSIFLIFVFYGTASLIKVSRRIGVVDMLNFRWSISFNLIVRCERSMLVSITTWPSNDFSALLGGPNVTITGSGFGTAAPKIFVGSSPATIFSYSDTKILLRLPPNSAGSHVLVVQIDGKGHVKWEILKWSSCQIFEDTVTPRIL